MAFGVANNTVHIEIILHAQTYKSTLEQICEQRPVASQANPPTAYPCVASFSYTEVYHTPWSQSLRLSAVP